MPRAKAKPTRGSALGTKGFSVAWWIICLGEITFLAKFQGSDKRSRTSARIPRFEGWLSRPDQSNNFGPPKSPRFSRWSSNPNHSNHFGLPKCGHRCGTIFRRPIPPILLSRIRPIGLFAGQKRYCAATPSPRWCWFSWLVPICLSQSDATLWAQIPQIKGRLCHHRFQCEWRLGSSNPLWKGQKAPMNYPLDYPLTESFIVIQAISSF